MGEEVKISIPENITLEQVAKIVQKMSKQTPEKGEDMVFKKWEAGLNKELRVEKSYFKGRKLLGIRKYWREDETQEFKPGKGVTFTFEDIEEIIEGLQAMLNHFEDPPED